MNSWDSRVRDHVIWSELKQTGVAVDNAIKREGIEAESIAGIERVRFILSLVGRRLASTDPFLVSPNVINLLAQDFSKIRSELEAFIADGLLTRIANANTWVDEVICRIQLIPGPSTPDDLSVLSQSAAEYRSTIQGYLDEAKRAQAEIKVATQKLSEKVTKLEVKIAEEEGKLSLLITEHQSQFSALQDQRATTFSTTLSEQQSKFSADQDHRNTLFNSVLLTQQQDVAAKLNEYSEKLISHEADFAKNLKQAENSHIAKLDDLNTKFTLEASEILLKISQHKSDVESLVGVIGNLGVTSGYQKAANEARRTKQFWQLLTVLPLLGLIVVAFFLAFPPEKSLSGKIVEISENADVVSIDKKIGDIVKKGDSIAAPKSTPVTEYQVNNSTLLEGYLTRLFLSITFGIFAAYAARQAKLSFESEQRNRKLALELEALGPFIEPLDKTEKDSFRIKMGERTFATPETEPQNNKDADPTSALSLIKPAEWLEVIRDIIKEAKR